jgi:YVTN family beta-propeller protein
MKFRIAVALLLGSITAQSQPRQIDASNWGSITAPVYGMTESGVYRGAELFAGPNKFGGYFSGVLPNGKIVKPAGLSIQVGKDPLGAVLTPDGKFLITSNDDDRNDKEPSLQSPINLGGHTLSVIDTATMAVVSQMAGAGKFFIGLQATGAGPYTLWASGGGDNDVKLFTISTAGQITKATPANIVIKPLLPSNAGYVSNYTPDARFNANDAAGNKTPVPVNFNRTAGTQITFPAGSALSPDGKFLYVACNGDNSVAVIDTASKKVVQQAPAGYFPYGVVVSPLGGKIAVSNWGISEYKFVNPAYDAATGKLKEIGILDGNQPTGFYSPITSTTGENPKTSSISILAVPGGDATKLNPLGAVYQGKPLDDLYQVGDTHPSAMALVRRGALEVLYVTKSNNDSLGMIVLNNNRKMPDFDLSPVDLGPRMKPAVHGAYPNAIAVSPDNTRVYVAESGLNSVAVLDSTDPLRPKLLGRIPTGWSPTAVVASPDGLSLFVVNARGVGPDINPNTDTTVGAAPPTGLFSHSGVDSNYIFGSVQKVVLKDAAIDNITALNNNFAINAPSDISVVPAGGAPSRKIKHVFFILHENKTFDSMLGNLSARFGPFASLGYNDKTGKPYSDNQYTRVTVNTQTLASKFATAANYYSDAEESDVGHQFAASGTASDYSEKTENVKTGRGLLANKNMEPEDYPEAGYIFNNAARHGVTFKNYGELIRLVGTDAGASTQTVINDPTSGNMGAPALAADNASLSSPLKNLGDVQSETEGLGQNYSVVLPVLAVMGPDNWTGEPRLDRNYPGWNFNISDQRRAQEFNADFDAMQAYGTVPQFLYIYQPNDHTGTAQAANASSVQNKATGATAAQQVADGDTALGMVVKHIMESPIYYDPQTGEGSAIFITWDDAQATLDHIHPHRTPLIVISPYAKPSYTGLKHYSTSSIVKTEELLLGLPPNNLGDLFATDLRDLFQPTYNGIRSSDVPVTRTDYKASPESQRIWELVKKLDTSGPDKDSRRLGALGRLSVRADELRAEAVQNRKLNSRAYRKAQAQLYKEALAIANGPKDDD